MYKLLFGGVISLSLIACGDAGQPAGTDEAAVDTTSAPVEAPPAEFADAKYMDLSKQITARFTSEDVDGWLSYYADNARYNWSGGDSLVGKEAIGKYWKDRFANVVDSLKFNNEIWLPVKVNKPQSIEAPGIWLLGWYQVDVKYKNGKKLAFWAHMDHHIDVNGKIDQTILYIDRAPINAALTSK
ncbi:MAG TPA: nuclear transport factor 2 family protein [Saprospiraceae bacterium]|nr:nuclear transport factor 2 family protein [Saprospiraceae bacterium]